MPERLTPDSTRRDGVPARPIRLADGAEWGLALPTVRITPKVVAEFDSLRRPMERVTVELGFGHPPGVRRLIECLKVSCQRGTVAQQYGAFFGLAAELLCRAHEISMETACELLSVSDAELPQFVRVVMAVASEADRAPGGNPVEVPSLEP